MITHISKKDVYIKQVILSDEDIYLAERYFYKKATEEIKHFQKAKLGNLTEKEEILYYNGRILPNEVNIITPLSEAIKDLTITSFCVPAIEKHSPIAYGIVNDIHWNHPVVKHSGVETTWRYVLKVFIIEGREVVKNESHVKNVNT